MRKFWELYKMGSFIQKDPTNEQRDKEAFGEEVLELVEAGEC